MRAPLECEPNPHAAQDLGRMTRHQPRPPGDVPALDFEGEDVPHDRGTLLGPRVDQKAGTWTGRRKAPVRSRMASGTCEPFGPRGGLIIWGLTRFGDGPRQ